MASGLSDDSHALQPRIQVSTRYFPPSEPALPALAVQTTRMVDTYMFWVGTTDLDAEGVQNAPLQGCLSKDWACAMPMRESVSVAASPAHSSRHTLQASSRVRAAIRSTK